MADGKAAGTPTPPPGVTTPATSSAAAPLPPPMSAPSIPNLLARLGSGPPRAGRGGRRGRGRGREAAHGHRDNYGHDHGHGNDRPSGRGSATNHNAVIQGTDTDAAISRLSAVDIGLLEDPFAQFFAGDGGPSPRRLPIINRGTYTRTQALDTIIGAFLSHPSSPPDASEAGPPPRQVVSLGAGTDTRSLRLLSQQKGAFHNVIYHEIDFPAVSTRKRNIVQSVPVLRSLLANPITEHDPVPIGDNNGRTDEPSDASKKVTQHRSWCADLGRGNQLWGHGLDLRALATATVVTGSEAGGQDNGGNTTATTTAAAAAATTDTANQGRRRGLELAGLRRDVPTLVVSECCLCYLQPSEAAGVLRWFADRIPQPAGAAADAAGAALGVVLYEPIRPHDPFGRTMVANLAARGIVMPTLAVYPDGTAQEARLRQEAGLARAGHRTVDAIWDAWVSAAEKERVNQLDGLDEVEEWILLASHYVVAWGSRGSYFDAAWAQLYP
ncbi:saga-like transcriptional regulatory complex subunit [Niveomyces insectorum RCEF 264]|uniref:Leucine carboxyl methyltransferase 1 n=1 Tax=Niveomyces insectorum RCEF 264 TaxID=1081102 RepID=A0A167ZZK5_9HYPO|nr:saga-like transcriptional regulatory complex subunit [Niveomyces insectorum RCEF 264]